MITFTRTAELREYLHPFRAQGKKIGFVPTLGALHPGHISLVEASKANADITVCSIFVNPTQFNNRQDFEKYPNTIAGDRLMLEQANCDVLFLPSEKEIYPDSYLSKVDVDLGLIGKVLEGAHRPGHFEGVMQVVKILLDAVQPDMLFMGEKDFQQCAVIRKLLDHYQMNIKLVICPTIREKDGLAMSSRNMRLTETQRKAATILYKVLFNIRNEWQDMPPSRLLDKYRSMLEKSEDIQLEYLELVNAKTFEKVTDWRQQEHVQACIAAYVGDVRLIDNVIIF